MHTCSNKQLLDRNEGAVTSALYQLMDDDYIIRRRTLSCANVSSEELQDFVIRWTKNLNDLESSGNNNTNFITVTSSGFYCCQLRRSNDSSFISTFCATVLISGKPILYIYIYIYIYIYR